ncbi:hypothetical protein [Peribacillus asahii]|uniref:hypothetical protein n=1 Tax=Peribacillus asahii TaxID=228899 RepID=UPI00207A3401|nr:hypothetical protein [Peribacillus asahii]USK69322.1 hypothetical protein LIS76_17435 [Peribacillus asahii]
MADKVGLSYLEKLVGKTVTVFKGGPHSRTGELLAVQSDYLVIKTEDQQVVYYPLTQLKSVIDNTKNSTVSIENLYTRLAAQETIMYPDTFQELVQSLQLGYVQVNGGGPSSSKGYLLDAKSEYIALTTEEKGLVFYRLDQIKSLSTAESEFSEVLPTIAFGGSELFTDLLRSLLLQWTTVNHGPDKVEGILIEVNDEYSVLVKHKEVIYVPNDSINFVAQKVAVEEEENSQDGNMDSTTQNIIQPTITQSDTQPVNSSPARTSARNSTIRRMLIENIMRNSTVGQ